jgi:hypothetical protein
MNSLLGARNMVARYGHATLQFKDEILVIAGLNAQQQGLR